jgi:hypothetical protein
VSLRTELVAEAREKNIVPLVGIEPLSSSLQSDINRGVPYKILLKLDCKWENKISLKCTALWSKAFRSAVISTTKVS